MKIHDPDSKFTIMISPKELAEKLGIDGEIVSLFMRKGFGGGNITKSDQERIEMKVIKEIKK